MVSERDRINKIIDYLKSEGVLVNISKNKAQGNKGFFRINRNSNYRIDISKGLTDNEILTTLIHEFVHYVHYKYVKDLTSLDFIFPDFNENLEQELLDITVSYISRDFASFLFKSKECYKKEIAFLLNQLKVNNQNFNLRTKRLYPEPIIYFTKYEKFSYNDKMYNLENISQDFKFLSEDDIMYIKLKLNQNKLKRINSKISKLNKYYNNKSELFARFCELFFLQRQKAIKIAPLTSKNFIENVIKFNIKEFIRLNEMLS